MKYFTGALAAALVSLSLGAHARAASEKILPSTISVNTTNHTAVLPLYRGSAHGETVWYIVTDASNAATARRLRVIYSPSLANIGAAATQSARRIDGRLLFAGAPNFAPTRIFVPSAAGFPPSVAHPGGIADAFYSPFVRVRGERGILNAPIVATGNGPFDVVHHRNTEDRVLAIDTKTMRVTLTLARGFFDGKPIYYISPDASNPVAATVERATYVPRLAKAQIAATIPIGVVADGPTGAKDGQGLKYLTLHTPLRADATLANAAHLSAPFNILSLVPNVAHLYASNAYSPLWGVQVLGAPQKTRITSYDVFAAFSPKPAGFFVNCPVIAFGDSGAAGY
ncbi:MAG: hypothetical protein HKL91_00120 [Candidatus Eremiobacteraeota bacterium]|uniref:DUF7482 domain-containing protein n=1 Tax=mine drainage metagenome TaxID=410659 RepID=E6PEM2_9ZZZZ|nr:hypothetical protein [Candidatus Eremiobacteraeota bacterium]